TRCYRDWSSDVCSSDLIQRQACAHPEIILHKHVERVGAKVIRFRPGLDGSKLRQAQQKIGKVVPRTWNRRSARVLSGRKTREGEAALRVSCRPEALQNSPVIAADPQVVLAPAPRNEGTQPICML